MTETSACKCCGCYTLGPIDSFIFELCDVCYWESDPVQAADPDFEGGANRVSLKTARQNYKSFGASELQFVKSVRKPTADELPENN
ncbi:CPCC family cysteine-rich protein [Roseibium sp. SCP14]|uniref:CPCC family cysteine-rich protein n=1 Tax=Roseibium sp. SCP14 TaxID=3141375 RepID=UPI00333B2476